MQCGLMDVRRRLQGLQHQQQQVTHHKPSSEHPLSGRQVGGVGGGAWSADRDVSDSDDDEGGEICVVDDDETTNNNNNDDGNNDDDDDDDDDRRRSVASPRHNAAAVRAGYRLNSAYSQQLSPSRSSADIYPSHKLQGHYFCHHYG